MTLNPADRDQFAADRIADDREWHTGNPDDPCPYCRALDPSGERTKQNRGGTVMISPELRDKMATRLPELMMEVGLAVGYLDAKGLPPDVDARIDTIGEALTEITEMLRDVTNAALGAKASTVAPPSD